MDNYYLALYKGKGRWSDRLIRWWTGSIYSHAEIYVTKYELCYSATFRDGGVRVKQIKVEDSHNWDLIRIHLPMNGFMGRFKRQRGKKYDVINLFFTHFFKLGKHKKINGLALRCALI